MRIKRRKNTNSLRYKKNEEVVLKDKELDRHRRAFLGKRGSKLWNDFYSGLEETKRRLFQGKKSINSGKTRKNQSGGENNYTAEENAIFNIISALVNIETGKWIEDESSKEEYGIVTVKKRECGATMGWLVDLFENDDMPELLKFAKKHVEANTISLPEVWGVIDVTKLLSFIQNPATGPCKAEDIKVQYIPFFLQVYIRLIETLRESVSKRNRNDLFDNKSVETKTPINKSVEIKTPINKSDETKTPIDVLTAIGVSVLVSNGRFNHDKSDNNDDDKSDDDGDDDDGDDGDGDGDGDDDDGDDLTKQNAHNVTDSKKKTQPQNIESPEKLRNLILFNITLLRTMNMYANPMFFDDLYYYYYFLGLDEIFPGMDDFFRFFEFPEKEKNKDDSKVDVEMLIYQQFPKDDASKEAQDKKYYGYEMREVPSGLDVATDFDRFLNLVQLHPDPYYKLPIVAKTTKEFRLQNMDKSYEKDKKKGDADTEAPNIMGLSVTNPPPIQEGGGGLFNFIEYYLDIPDSGSYKYLDDNPLIRNFEDVLLPTAKNTRHTKEGVRGLSEETPEEFRTSKMNNSSEDANYDGDVYLCIYSLDKSCNFDGNGVTPFLKFITTKPSDKWGFPSFHYKSLFDPEQNNDSFKCDMFNALMNCLEIRLCSNTGGGLEIKAEDTKQANTNSNSDQINKPVAAEPVAAEPVASPVATEPISNPIVESLKEEPPIIVQPEQMKQDCFKIDSLLDSVFVGLVSEDIQGKKRVFAFLNYDVLAGMIQSPDNPILDAVFCINKDTHIYPIADSNTKSKLKWATVDELYFERKIIEDEVDSTISELFSKHYNLWNIENDGKYAIIPFVVYKVEKKNDVFTTVQANLDNSEDSGEMIEEYGSKDDSGIADDYDERYCFTIHPLGCSSSQDASCKDRPRRYAMFAWKTRYVVTESDVALLNGDQEPPQSDNMMPPQNGGDQNSTEHALSEEEKDNIASERLLYPTLYTITTNKFTKNVPTVTWGIKNKDQFVGL